MRVKYAGFNLFGLISQNQSLIKSFTEFKYDSLKTLHLTHTFGIVQNDELKMFLYGYFDEKTHQNVEIKTGLGKVVKKVSVYDNKMTILFECGGVYNVNIDGDLSLNKISVNIDEDDCIVDISAGPDFIIGITKNGFVYDIPNKLDFVNKEIVQVETGREHCILLDKTGNVYTFGSGSKGQLGHGDLTNKDNPVLVEALAGIKIDKIAAGGWHSCALSDSGDMYTWGWNQDNQLGLFEDKDVDKKAVVGTPEPVNFPDFEASVEDIACGTRHTVALLGNKLYGAGMNKYFQLGNNKSNDETAMKCLYEADGDVLDLICGPWSTAILMSDNKTEAEENVS
ncbi:RCC1 domain-containing protein 1 isoform X1 [Onthophagus taurus]|uniref:RCC1 domain-containing protein 1 isoform X1 n=1 Tax=Onthophagus taurus TaxID=166361 RepID=UPI0039BE9D29